MRTRSRKVLMVWAVMAAWPLQAATVAVTITGLSDTGYELEVSGIRKLGRLGPVPGPATVRDLVDIGQRGAVTASVRFVGAEGVIASCPEVEIKVEGPRQACEPAFTLTAAQIGSAGYACKTTCERPRGEKSRVDEDDDDWVYASSGAAGPRLDGWALSQFFYSDAMSQDRGRLIYSASGKGL